MDRQGRLGLVLVVVCLVSRAPAARFYVDAESGHDRHDGRSPDRALQSLARVNGLTLAPGDHLLFRAGCRWSGHLSPRGSGTAEQPIRIDRYGEGPDPVFDGQGLEGRGVLTLHNVSFWEVRHLEITNDAPQPGDRRGVQISAANAGTLRHLLLQGLTIHHIKGIVGQSIKAKDTGGIGVFIEADDERPTRFDDVQILDCNLATIDNTGIFTRARAAGKNTPGSETWNRRRITKLHIAGNRVHDIAKNAMIIRLADGGLVERNVCWDTAYRTGTGNTIFARSSRGTVFQFNEGYLNRSRDYDGCLYDADLESPDCIFQYSYSHDNAHGLFWMCTAPEDANIVVRYNVSQNDRGNIFCINYANTSCHIYNNVVFVPAHLSPHIIDERRNADKAYTFTNNVIINLSPTARYVWKNARRTFRNNLFFGIHPDSEPDDPYKRTDDPRLRAPGTGTFGLDSLDGYRLRPDSPCIDTGAAVPLPNDRDLWGTPVPSGRARDRGAAEWLGGRSR